MSTPILSADLFTKIKDTVINDLKSLKSSGVVPKLVAIGATDDESVLSYERSKQKNAATVGIEYSFENFVVNTTQQDLEARIKILAADPSVHGICLSLPLHKHLDSEAVLRLIPQNKDVDGLGPENLGLIAAGAEDRAIIAATPQSCLLLAAEALPDLKGKTACVMGRGRTVGKILAQLLINRDATVTVCHSRTKNPQAHTQDSDIVFCAIGKPRALGADYFKAGQVLVDAGIGYVDGKLYGDIDAESIATLDVKFTPVPGGVGKLTTMLIFQNLIKCIGLQR